MLRVAGLTACALLVTSCASALPGGPNGHERAPTVTASADAGQELEPGIVVVGQIPVDELRTSGPARIDHADVCGSLPPAALAELGYQQPHDAWSGLCQWLDKRHGHHFVNIGYAEQSMAEQVDVHRTEPVSHLRWMRIDGHYALERILKFDPLQSCGVLADYGAPETLQVLVYTGLETATEDAVEQLCPKSRWAAQIVLRHLSG